MGPSNETPAGSPSQGVVSELRLIESGALTNRCQDNIWICIQHRRNMLPRHCGVPKRHKHYTFICSKFYIGILQRTRRFQLPLRQLLCRDDVQWLEEEGIRVWFFQRRIRAAHQNYGEAIVGNLKKAGVVLFYLSASSNNSDPCANEAKIVKEEDKRIISIKVDDVKVSD